MIGRSSVRPSAQLLRRLSSLFLLSFLAACDTGAQPTEAEILARAGAVHDAAITIDTHVDILGDWGTQELDPCSATHLKVDIPKMEAGGVDMMFPAVYVGQGPLTPEGRAAAKETALNRFAAIHRVVEEMCPDKVEIAYRADDVERIVASGKRVFGVGVENGYSIGGDLSLVERFYDMGARYIGLTHSGHNDIADSSTPRAGPAEEWGGLSPFGQEVVREMNRLGIMVDVSHVSDDAVRDILSLTRAPIIASHSGARAVADVARNLSDELLLALKENGGVIQVVALGSYVKVPSPERANAIQALRDEFGLADRTALRDMTEGEREIYAERMEELRPAYEARMAEIDAQWPPADVSDFVDHMDHVKNLIGVDHVGVGTDFDGGGGIPGINDASEALNVTVEMVRRGYSDEEIRKIWGGNLLRVWREVERVAAEIQAEGL
jgi:microsomal dipeptidase-like Zn-dependent dipeptidase